MKLSVSAPGSARGSCSSAACAAPVLGWIMDRAAEGWARVRSAFGDGWWFRVRETLHPVRPRCRPRVPLSLSLSLYLSIYLYLSRRSGCGSGRRLVTGSCVCRETTRTGRPRLVRAVLYLSIDRSGAPRCALRTAPEAGTRTQYVQYRGALLTGRPAPPVRTQRGRPVRVARAYPTEAPGRACQPSAARGRSRT